MYKYIYSDGYIVSTTLNWFYCWFYAVFGTNTMINMWNNLVNAKILPIPWTSLKIMMIEFMFIYSRKKLT